MAQTYLGLLALLEESLLGLLLSLLLLGEVVGGRDLLQSLGVDAGNVDALGGGDHVAGVDTADGNTVNLEGTGDEENTLVEVLEENDTLATEAASEEDQNGTRLEALTELSGTQSLANLYAQIHVSNCSWAFCDPQLPGSRAWLIRSDECEYCRGPIFSSSIAIATGHVELNVEHRCRLDSIRDPAPIFACIQASQRMPVSSAKPLSFVGVYADLLGLRLIVHGVPLLGLLGRVRHSPLALSKLLRLANSSVRHGGCDEDGVGGCRVGGWVLRLMCGLASGV